MNQNLKITLKENEQLKEIVIHTGKTSKKDNPALDILRKIWERRRKNGLKMFKQYQYEKYEKVEFDLNTIDSAFMNSKVFKGMEFVFDQIDTSSILFFLGILLAIASLESTGILKNLALSMSEAIGNLDIIVFALSCTLEGEVKRAEYDYEEAAKQENVRGSVLMFFSIMIRQHKVKM